MVNAAPVPMEIPPATFGVLLRPREISPVSFTALLAAIFGVLALVLAATGIYGVLARRHDPGINLPSGPAQALFLISASMASRSTRFRRV
jgi:hypothetical protein